MERDDGVGSKTCYRPCLRAAMHVLAFAQLQSGRLIVEQGWSHGPDAVVLDHGARPIRIR